VPLWGDRDLDLDQWWEVHVACTEERAPWVVARLGRAGCRALLTDRDASSRVVFRGYLLAARTPPAAVTVLYLALIGDASRRGQPSPEVRWRQLRWRDLPDEVALRIQPGVDVGRRLRVQSPLEPTPDDGARIVVRLHPSAAFGNAVHATTRLCLEALEGLVAPGSPTPCGSVVDLGTGSGVLAVAAALLGATEVHAADTDLLSVRAARANRGLNGLGPGTLAIHLGSCDALAAAAPRPVDGILCNMLAGPLLPLVPCLCDLGGRRAWAVISGFSSESEQEADLRAAFHARGWTWTEPRSAEGWGCAVARAPDGCR
jgi:ribosomal protein L11 methyltransferase